MRRRLIRGALVVGLAVAALSYGSLQKRVVVRIDGRPVAHVQTFATSVGDALRRAHIQLGPDDRVVPPPRAPLGHVVDVFRAKPIVILLDGKPRRLLVTGQTVEQVLREVELRSSMADFVRPSRAARVRSGMTITYRKAVALRVVHDGKAERVITNAASVRRVLAELGLRLGRKDPCGRGCRSPPDPG